MANGPGISWGAGVPDASQSEQFAQVLDSRATGKGWQTHNSRYAQAGLDTSSGVPVSEASDAVAARGSHDSTSSLAIGSHMSGEQSEIYPISTVSIDGSATQGPAKITHAIPAPAFQYANMTQQGAETANREAGSSCLNRMDEVVSDDAGAGVSTQTGALLLRGDGAGMTRADPAPTATATVTSDGIRTSPAATFAITSTGCQKQPGTSSLSGLPGVAAGGLAGSGVAGCAGESSLQLLSLGNSSSLLEYVSREVIRKLRLAASAGSAEDRHVVCEELFADITCALDASAQAALLGPAADAGLSAAAEGEAVAGSGPAVGSGGGSGHVDAAGAAEAGGGTVLSSNRRSRVLGLLYYEVLAVYYASRAAADSARALLHLCQLLWDTPWVAPIFTLLLHRFLLLPREVAATATSPHAASTAAGAAAAAATGSSSSGGGASKPSYGMSYSNPRVKHLNVLTHGARQLLLGDVHSGLSRFQPLWAFLALEVAGLAPQPPACGGGDGGRRLAEALALPPVTSIDAVPLIARPWLLAVAAAFLPYYCLDEHVAELSRRFPPPLPVEGTGPLQIRAFTAGGAVPAAATASASQAGLDFLIVEVTDVLGRINSEAGLLKYLRALRALARSPPPPPSLTSSGQLPAVGPEAAAPQSAHHQPPAQVTAAAAAEATALQSQGAGTIASAPAVKAQQGLASRGPRRKAAPAEARPRRAPPPPPPPPLAGLPTITKLRLQSELYSLTSGGGPRYAPPEVRRAAFAALDSLFPGGRSLRWLVRWASRTLHLEWLEGDGTSDDPWASRGWLGWIYWPIHWCTALYGRILLAIFQLIYGIVVWRPWARAVAADVASVAGTAGVITANGPGGGGNAVGTIPAAAVAATSAGVKRPSDFKDVAAAGRVAEGGLATGSGTGPGRPKAGPWWQPRLRGQG